MTCWEEVQSGKFSIYGQWSAIITAVILIVLGIAQILTIVFLPFCLLAWVFAFIIVLIEIPLCQKCCPIPACMEPAIKFADQMWVHGAYYLTASGIMFLSVFIGASIFILAAILLFICSILYFIALLKKEERKTSRYTGAAGLAEVAIGSGVV